jgi:hypothetical protein
MNDTRIQAWLEHPPAPGTGKDVPDEKVMIVEFIAPPMAGILAVIYSEETGKFDTARLDRLIKR